MISLEKFWIWSIINIMVGYIYKITNPSGKVYIGKTIDLETRMSKYKYLNCKNQTRLYASLLKYGWQNHVFETIETILVFDDNLDILEKYHIKENNSYTKGLNCTLGGDGLSGINFSEETRTKMRNSQLGRKHSKETIEKRILATTGKKRSEAFKKRLSEAHTGKVLSEVTKEKLRQINLGKISPIRIKCKLVNLLTNESWESNSLMELSTISPLSLPTITRLKSNRAGKKITSIYKLEY